jgi:hypothetical protein
MTIKNRKTFGGVRLFELENTGELLQFFTSTGVTFEHDDSSLSATGIGTDTFAEGDYVTIGASAQSANNTTFRIVTLAADKMTVDGVITDDNAGETITINQTFVGDWFPIDSFTKLVGVIKSPSNCTGYIDQSNDGSTVAYSTPEAVTGGTALAFSVEVVALYARLRIINGGTDQASFLAFVNGRTLT